MPTYYCIYLSVISQLSTYYTSTYCRIYLLPTDHLSDIYLLPIC